MKDEIKSIFKTISDESILDIKSAGGYSGNTYQIIGKDTSYYCKIYPNNQNIARKTLLTHQIFLQNKIPCPNVLYSDIDGSEFKFPIIITESLIGNSITDANRNDTKSVIGVYRHFGELTAKIHSIEFNKFGDLQEENNTHIPGKSHNFQTGPYDTWSDFMKPIQKFRFNLLKNSVFKNMIPQLKKFSKTYLDNKYVIKPRLCHGDLNRVNIIVNGTAISGFVDFDEVIIGNCEEELMRIELDHFAERPLLRKYFYETYFKNIKLDQGYAERSRFFYVSRNLISLNISIHFKYSDEYTSKIASDIEDVMNGGDFLDKNKNQRN